MGSRDGFSPPRSAGARITGSFHSPLSKNESLRQGDPRAVRCDVVGVDLGLKNAAVIHDGNLGSRARAIAIAPQEPEEAATFEPPVGTEAKGIEPTGRKRNSTSSLGCTTGSPGERQDFLHQLSSSLVRTKSVIVLDHQNVNGMGKNRHLALSIGDASFGELRRQLTYKSGWNGVTLAHSGSLVPFEQDLLGLRESEGDTLAQRARVRVCELRRFDRSR